MITVDFAPNYNLAMDDIAEFMLKQDLDSAPRRAAALQAEIDDFIRLVKLQPKIGKPYNPPPAKNEEARRKNKQLAALISRTGLSEARERVLRDYVLLYAYSDTRVVFISIRHQRQSAYSLISQ